MSASVYSFHNTQHFLNTLSDALAFRSPVSETYRARKHQWGRLAHLSPFRNSLNIRAMRRLFSKTRAPANDEILS
ncbi:hypothetical protein ACQZV8_17410 [Magnetococcales bacterium HHB-1]